MANFYYRIGDPNPLKVPKSAFKTDFELGTEVWSYNIDGTATTPITFADSAPTKDGVSFEVQTNDETLRKSYPITVTATLASGETNSDYKLTIHLQTIHPPKIEDVLYYVRDTRHVTTIPTYTITPFLGETLTY